MKRVSNVLKCVTTLGLFGVALIAGAEPRATDQPNVVDKFKSLEFREIGQAVIVAAEGHLWGPNEERGVYKTTDGGKTWSQVLKINEDTGVSDIAMDPQSPDILYAAAYERRRTVFGFNGGGPDGGIYKTSDGGATWKRITKGLAYENGGDIGRIGLDVYRYG